MESLKFPLFFDMSDRKIVIVGAGTIATRRAETLVDFDTAILVIAPDGTQRMRQLEAERLVRWEHRGFAAADIDGAWMVLTATDDPAVNAQVVRVCRERGIMVNHAGDKSQSDFYFPGIAHKGSLVAGVTASGKDHRLARRAAVELRKWLSEFDTDTSENCRLE